MGWFCFHWRYELLSHQVGCRSVFVWFVWPHKSCYSTHLFQGWQSYSDRRYSSVKPETLYWRPERQVWIKWSSQYHRGHHSAICTETTTEENLLSQHFNKLDFANDIAMAPFHVAHIFDDVNDMAWFHAALIKYVMDSHAHIKTEIIKNESVPFVHSKLQKAQYKRNMARNKFRRFGKKYWNENRRQRKNVVKIRKQSLKNVLALTA